MEQNKKQIKLISGDVLETDITKVEIISNEKGREVVRHPETVMLSLQDGGKTLKIFTDG